MSFRFLKAFSPAVFLALALFSPLPAPSQPTAFPSALSDRAKEPSIILLNAAHLDTSKAEIKALRQPLGAFAGKRLHLVQFAGPVQSAWHKDLLATGVELVSFIPHHAYLIYGDAASLARVQSLAAAAPYVQWEAPY